VVLEIFAFVGSLDPFGNSRAKLTAEIENQIESHHEFVPVRESSKICRDAVI